MSVDTDDITDAVVVAINAHTFSAPYSASLGVSRELVSVAKLEDLSTLKVTAVSLSLAGTPIDRARREEQNHEVGISFRLRFSAPADKTLVRPLVTLVRQVKDFLKGAGPMAGASPIKKLIQPIIDGKRLDETGEFLSLLTMTYWIIQ